MNSKISATIITLNEEDFIKDCIQSVLQVADEIIVIDSHSTDNTREIAQSLGAKVFEHPFQGYGLQKNVAMEKASNDWILNIDADERLDDQLIAAIKNIDMNSPFDAYAFSRKNYIGNRWQKAWSPDYVIRLYNKQRCGFNEVVVHESVKSQNCKQLPGNLIHYSFKNLSDCLMRADKYSKLDAKRLFDANRKANTWDPALHGFVSFIKFFLVKKGILYGADGLTSSIIGALRSYLKYAYLLEMRQNL